MTPFWMRNAGLFICFLLMNWTATAQESLNCSGGDASATSGSVAYSIGQPFFHTWYGPSNNLSEGVQQPCEGSGQGFHQIGSEESIWVFPNPALHTLIIHWETHSPQIWEAKVLDGLGRFMLEQPLMTSPERINIENLPPSFYFLQIRSKDQKTMTTKKFLKIP